MGYISLAGLPPTLAVPAPVAKKEIPFGRYLTARKFETLIYGAHRIVGFFKLVLP